MADYNSSYTGQQVDDAVRDVINNRTEWSSKYKKPYSGIPEGDLSDAVRQKLNQSGTAGVLSINGVSGVLNLRTVNGNDLLGTGDIKISGGTVDVDDYLSDFSENPVQNKVIKEALDAKYTKPSTGITADDLASKCVTSDKLADNSIKTINNESLIGPGNITIGGGGTITVDDRLSSTSTNPVQNKVITDELNNKQAKLQSGMNIKTINGATILGSGNLDVTAPDTSWDYNIDAERLRFYNEISLGAVTSVNGKSGDVWLTVSDIGMFVDKDLSDTSTNPVQNKTIKAALESMGGPVLVVNFSESSSNVRQYDNAAITENHELIYYEFGTPSNVTGETTVVTANGRVTVRTGLSGATSIKLVLAEANKLN